MKVPSPLLWKRMFLPPLSPGGPQATMTPLYRQGPDLGDGRGGEIEVDVVGDEQIEACRRGRSRRRRSRCPSESWRSGDAGLRADIGEGAIAVVVVEDVLAPVGDEQIVVAVVVVVADADALSPAGVDESGFGGDVGEGAVAIVFEEMVGGLLSGGKAFEARAVDEEDVQPAVVVVVDRRRRRSRWFRAGIYSCARRRKWFWR